MHRDCRCSTACTSSPSSRRPARHNGEEPLMRLRTRLALAFALLALVPLAVGVPLTLNRLRTTLSRELDARLEGATTSAPEALERSAERAQRAIEELVESTAMEDLARDAREMPTRAIQADTAEGLMKSRG